MITSSYKIPILFIVFNRPEIAQQVFDEIKKQRPKHLFIAADAPRVGVVEDIEKCQKTREIINQIDWDCELKTLFQDKNLGCAKGPATAITWFFDNVEEGIILEDDCLPHPDFFPYCEELLEKYRDNNEVQIISGDNFFNETDFITKDSYFFTKYTLTWGWATWRRTWKNFDLYLNNITSSEFDEILKTNFSNWNERKTHKDKFLRMKKRSMQAWDYQFLFSCLKNNGLNITPATNLISNIGTGVDSTHFSSSTTEQHMFFLPSHSILPLKHPKNIERSIHADKLIYQKIFKKNILQLAWRMVFRTFFAKKMFD